MLVIRAGIHKMLVRMKQSQSDLGLHSLTISFGQASSFRNFRTLTVILINDRYGNEVMQEGFILQNVQRHTQSHPNFVCAIS